MQGGEEMDKEKGDAEGGEGDTFMPAVPAMSTIPTLPQVRIKKASKRMPPRYHLIRVRPARGVVGMGRPPVSTNVRRTMP